MDISDEAIEVAKQNALDNAVNIHFVLDDIRDSKWKSVN
jgi:methylase of polypeptide subunit release factors